MQVAVLGTGMVGRAIAPRLAELGHRDVIDLGGIETARGAEMWLPLWLRLMGALGTAEFNLKIVRRS
ncbi:hypothetical protein [Nocardioides pinisoli]|uniref:Uncharacterized protein n=1 Tax=Nocardioides pinisoli TaxID=2950279 RepID=A0ABT1KXT7_9ACTN|nr:hypothetical protein [Nocardioides pinisoli]MCP3422583.1 hypothetical protein [Nocardioides pinisoli]